MLQPGRKYSGGSGYRYGFNGKENDREVNGDGNEYDYGNRIYFNRIGKWLSIDKLQFKHPDENPYLFVGNNPLYYVDPDGKDRIEHIRIIGKDGTVLIKTQTTKGLYRSVWNSSFNNEGYATKNDYEVFTTQDLRGKAPKITSTENILYGVDHVTEVGFGTYLKIKITGSDGDILPKLPQLIVYGSNTEDPGWGAKADPNRPITSIDFAAFQEIMKLVMLGMKVPDLKGADPKKIPELVKKATEEADRQKAKEAEKVDKKNKVTMCSECHSRFEVSSDGKNGTLTKKPATDTANLEQ